MDVFYGDLHRHTHFSRCAGGQDGTYLDAVRYARGPGALDFLAVTDHYQHLTPSAWWRSRRDAERWNATGSLVVFPGIERNVNDEGHQNLIWSTSEIARDSARDARPPKFSPSEVIAIPHMSSLSDNPFDWNAIDTERHRLIEVHQGRRGSYEGAGLPHAAVDISSQSGRVSRLPEVLSMSPGARLPGLISSGDHGATSNGYAGVYLPVPDRALRLPLRGRLFRALHDAQSFATTGPPPGKGSGPKRLHLENGDGVLEIQASSAGLSYIEIIRNGELVSRMDKAGVLTNETPKEDSRLLVNLRLLNRSGAELIIRARSMGDEDEEASIRRIQLRRDIGDGIEAKSIGPNSVKVTFPTTVRADADLLLDVHASDGALLEFVYQNNRSSWSDSDAVNGQAERIYLGKKEGRPLADVTRLSFSSSAAPKPASSQLSHATYALPAEDQSAVYYARAVWQDGSMAWSGMKRGAK